MQARTPGTSVVLSDMAPGGNASVQHRSQSCEYIELTQTGGLYTGAFLVLCLVEARPSSTVWHVHGLVYSTIRTASAFVHHARATP